MDDLHRKAVEGARFFFAKGAHDPFHGQTHVAAVAADARILAEALAPERADLIEVAAWWHDVGRVYVNDQHEELGAKLAEAYLRDLGFPPDDRKAVYDAIACHRWDMRPETMDGEIVRDADKLDFINPERWLLAALDGRLSFVDEVMSLLPQLRDHILHLDAARGLYDARIGAFREFALTSFPSPLLEGRRGDLLLSFCTTD